MLQAAELASMQATVSASLPDPCQVMRLTRTSDGAGGFTQSWAVVATTTCRISPYRGLGKERVSAEELKAIVLWTLTLPALTDVRVSDRIVLGSRTFEVHEVRARSQEVSRLCDCSEVQV